MRILVTILSAPSHLRRVLPAAQALRRRGHDVIVGVPSCLHEEIAAYSLEAVAIGPDSPGGVTDGESKLSPTNLTQAVVEQFIGEPLRQRALELLAFARDWHPDLILRDVAELGGSLAAETAGTPHVSIGSSHDYYPPDRLPRLDEHRAALGLPSAGNTAWLFRYLHVNLMPAAYDPAVLQVPNVRCYRPTNPERHGEALPQWIADLPERRPIVLASLGTVFHAAPGRFATILSVLAQIDCSAIVSIGRGKDPSRLPSHPDHIRLVDYLPQPLVLECCDLFLNHGGFNSIRESLRLGVPMVITPIFGDQPYNAQRCSDLGVARAFSKAAPSVEALLQACRAVLFDESYSARARALQRQILALPSLDTLAADLEQMFG
jgi:N-glycosyltransferase